jgi:hypothetical protein
VVHVPGSQAVRDQHLDLLAEELRPVVPEQAFGLGIGEHDPTVDVNDDHGVGRRLDEGFGL